MAYSSLRSLKSLTLAYYSVCKNHLKIKCSSTSRQNINSAKNKDTLRLKILKKCQKVFDLWILIKCSPALILAIVKHIEHTKLGIPSGPKVTGHLSSLCSCSQTNILKSVNDNKIRSHVLQKYVCLASIKESIKLAASALTLTYSIVPLNFQELYKILTEMQEHKYIHFLKKLLMYKYIEKYIQINLPTSVTSINKFFSNTIVKPKHTNMIILIIIAVLGIISFFIDKICFLVSEYNITNTNDIFVKNMRHWSFEILST
ncbi:hypothetical protein AGLY_005965 [Aphis glycines]|uniref:Uncharacterized protein n=1 Tax=Aphis glycines TaxID=307491 RepID=A0A6G0TSX6_APHGL|nr:hypothetical protein AGLY_005965 [Aphis glycines]